MQPVRWQCWKMIGLLLVTLCGLAVADEVAAQPGEPAADDREADHEELRQLKAVAEEAINTNQLELLRPYLDEPFSFVTYTDSEFTDFDTFQQQWQETRDELLDGGSYTTELLPERSRLFGDMAVCWGNSENVLVTGGGETFRFPSNWSAFCRKVDGEWRIVRAHSSLDPFDNPMLESHVRGLLIKVGIGALLVGVVLGWMIKMLLGRRQSGPQTATGTDVPQ